MMSEDKLSQEEMREDIKNLLSWGHAHDYDDIIQEARADAWDEGQSAGISFQAGGEYLENPYRGGGNDY